MKHLVTGYFPLIVLVVVLISATGTLSQSSRRDLQPYKEAPSFDLKNYYLPIGRQQRSLLRQLVWELWTKRTKAFSNVTFYSREGASTKCKLFVEPDSTGQWVIASECKPFVCPYLSTRQCRDYLRTLSPANMTSFGALATMQSPLRRAPDGDKFRFPMASTEIHLALSWCFENQRLEEKSNCELLHQR